jgi:hypothetical protein
MASQAVLPLADWQNMNSKALQSKSRSPDDTSTREQKTSLFRGQLEGHTGQPEGLGLPDLYCKGPGGSA